MKPATLAATLLCCCSSSLRADLWEPLGGAYRYETHDGEVFEGEYSLTFSSESPGSTTVRYGAEVAGLQSSFAFLDAHHVGYISALVGIDRPALMEGFVDFKSPDGRWFATGRHPTFGTAATGFTLDGEPMRYGEPIKVTRGVHRMAFALEGSKGYGGANLEVSPIPEPSAAGLLLVLLAALAALDRLVCRRSRGDAAV